MCSLPSKIYLNFFFSHTPVFPTKTPRQRVEFHCTWIAPQVPHRRPGEMTCVFFDAFVHLWDVCIPEKTSIWCSCCFSSALHWNARICEAESLDSWKANNAIILVILDSGGRYQDMDMSDMTDVSNLPILNLKKRLEIFTNGESPIGLCKKSPCFWTFCQSWNRNF